MFQEGLAALLAADANIAGLVGPRIYAMQMPEATQLPALVYRKIAELGDVAFEGATGFTSARFQFSCFGLKYADASLLAKAVRLALEGTKTTLADGTQLDNGSYISGVEIFEDAPFAYHTAVDLEFVFREAPTF